MKKVIFILLVAGMFGACANQQVVPTQKSNLTAGMVKKGVVEGVTSQTEVINLFGSPNLITTNSRGNEVWTYNKSSYGATSSSVNGGLGGIATGTLLGIFGVSGNSSASNTSTSSFDLIITFDKRGIVEKYRMISASY